MHKEDNDDHITVAQQHLQSMSRCMFTVVGLTAQQVTQHSQPSADVELVLQEFASSIKSFDTAIENLSHAPFITSHRDENAPLALDDVRQRAKERLQRLEERYANLSALWQELLVEEGAGRWHASSL